jgi:photosystem II reaction center protein Psb28
MTIKIQFLLENNQRQECVPDKIRLTKSINEETGTIVLSFSSLFPLDILLNNKKPIIGLYIIANEFFFFSKELRCIWAKGRPILIQAIFLIDKKEELFIFLKFFKKYAQKNGLTNCTID